MKNSKFTKYSMLDKLTAFLDSEEGMRISNEYWDNISRRESIVDNQLERFHEKYKNNLNFIIEKIIKKYNSNEYVLREHKLGREPMENLSWFLYSYAEKYCKSYNGKKYLNMFTTKAYYIGSYIIQELQGQGCAIKIDKVK